jgi:hypothetical protein
MYLVNSGIQKPLGAENEIRGISSGRKKCI